MRNYTNHTDNQKVGVAWKAWIWLVNTTSKSFFMTKMKWSYGRYGHFACGTLFERYKKVTDWRTRMIINSKGHQHIVLGRNLISQRRGQIVPTPCGKFVHASRASHLPYDAKKPSVQEYRQIQEVYMEIYDYTFGGRQIGSPRWQLNYPDLQSIPSLKSRERIRTQKRGTRGTKACNRLTAVTRNRLNMLVPWLELVEPCFCHA